MSDAASERVKGAVWTGKDDIFFRVTTLAKAVCHMSEICETWQISLEAALLLVACPRNLCLAALTQSCGCSLRGRHRTAGSTQENQLRAVFHVWAAHGLPHRRVQTPGACHACALRGPFTPHILHWLPKEGHWEEVRQVSCKPLQIRSVSTRGSGFKMHEPMKNKVKTSHLHFFHCENVLLSSVSGY